MYGKAQIYYSRAFCCFGHCIILSKISDRSCLDIPPGPPLARDATLPEPLGRHPVACLLVVDQEQQLHDVGWGVCLAIEPNDVMIAIIQQYQFLVYLLMFLLTLLSRPRPLCFAFLLLRWALRLVWSFKFLSFNSLIVLRRSSFVWCCKMSSNNRFSTLA